MISTRLVLGFLAGLLLATWRTASGADLFQIPAASYLDRAAGRGASLALLAVVVALGRPWIGRRTGGDLLLGAALGFTLRGLALHGTLSRALPLAVLAVAAVVALILARRAPVPEAGPVRGTPVRVPGLVAAGAGVGVLGEGLLRHVLRLGGGEPADAWLTGSVGLWLLVLGGLAFGRFLRTGKVDRAHGRATALALALTGPAGVVGLWVLARVGSVKGLDELLRGVGLDAGDRGTLVLGTVVAVQVLVVPALVLGTALYTAARRREELASVLAGLALGPLLVAWRLAVPEGDDWLPGDLVPASRLVVEGAVLAGIGGLLAHLSLPASRAVKLAGCLPALAALGTLALPVEPLPITRPWARNPVPAETVLELPEGLLALFPHHVTLDHAYLVPRPEDQPGDTAQILSSLAQAAPDAGPLRILLIGQLDPRRAGALYGAGREIARVDRSASWWRAMSLVEARLFGADPRPPGEVLSPSRAAARLADGEYDLVLVPGVPGQWTRLPPVDLPPTTRAVVWQAAGPLIDQELDPVLLAAGSLEDLWVGSPAGRAGQEERAELFEVASAPALVGALSRLRLSLEEREQADRVALARRLERAAGGAPPARLAAGLAEHFAVQAPSSPFESYPGTVELSEAAIALWGQDLEERTPGFFTREWWNALSFALVARRQVEWIREHLEPVVERDGWRAWTPLARALAYAEREALEPERAAERLLLLSELMPLDVELAHELADSLAQAGRHAESAAVWRRILDLEPGHHDGERDLAIQLLRAGDPQGRVLAEEWLEAHPEDEGLRAFLAPGPLPELDPTFEPGGHGHEEHGHDHGEH